MHHSLAPKPLRLILAVCLALAAASCAGKPSQLAGVPLAADGIATPGVNVEQILNGAYVLHPADTISVSVYRVDDLSGTYAISNTGAVSMPLLGEVEAAGMTPAAFGAKLERLYGARLLQDPSIVVQLEKSVGNRFSVDGAVAQPGVFEATPQTTLLQSVALARGLTENATQRVVILRKIGSENYAAAYDMGMVRSGQQPDPQIIGGDVVIADGEGEGGLELRDLLQFVPLIAVFVRLI